MADKKVEKKVIEKKTPIVKKVSSPKTSIKGTKTNVVKKDPALNKKVVKKIKSTEKRVKTPKKEVLEVRISHRRKLKATILKDNSKSFKFLNVEVIRYVAHPLYKKLVKKRKKYLVSCPQDIDFSVGEKILIEETSPISKRINFRYISKV
jgi:small subunit ribosomal protein S17